uniref:U12 n=2 Tax=Roseolovirus TaxID=40272 RepID=A0A1W6JEY6_9BETA|nr:U12 [Human betaherpesvirus 6]AVI08323.1 G-protein coupled receptor-like protein UL33 [Human betaherpesvirus 6B]ARM63444.1 U12 [Human betaherpesvirus 6]ARM64670.1 U12 [Human betaherpesvirus 6]AVI08564.1 G-protein coupled receptor-like protein UL33 [Human betaherpesvirus 6B]
MIIIVITTMILYHRVAKHNATSFYVITLFASDFVLMWCVFFMTVNREQLFSFNRFFCQLVYFIYHAVCSYSISMLAIIATIRYKTLHRRKQTESKTYSTGRNIGILLLASSMCAIPTALFVQINGAKKTTGKCVVYLSSPKAYELFLAVKIVFSFIWGVLPTMVFSFFYFIFCKALHGVTKKKHKKTLFFISILLLSFLLIQIPYIAILISEIAFLYMPQNTCFWLARAEILQLIIRLMPQVHCFSNPLVYAFTGGELRNRFTTCFQCPFFPKRLCSTQNRKQSDVSEHDQNSPSESSVNENEPP